MQFVEITRHRPTGNFRGRTQWWSLKIVMQVEVAVESTQRIFSCPPPPDCQDIEGWGRQQEDKERQSWRLIRTYWRDASKQDAYINRVFNAA